MADTIIDFEDEVFHPLLSTRPLHVWEVTSADASTGTFSIASTNQGVTVSVSSTFIFGDFRAGTFSVDYKISSEPTFDQGFILIDDSIVVGPISGLGSWTNFSTSLSVGFHKIEFRYTKDTGGNANADRFFIDNISLPLAYDDNGGITGRTLFDMEDGLVPVSFDNTDSTPWVNTAITADTGTKSLASGAGGVSNGSSSLKFTIPANESSLVTIRYRIDSEPNFDFGKIIVGGTTVIDDSGTSSVFSTLAYYVDSASSTVVEMLYTKDGSGQSGLDNFFVDNIEFGTAAAPLITRRNLLSINYS